MDKHSRSERTEGAGHRGADGRLACLVLAAGSGRRFGADKLRAELLGKPVISYVLDAARAVSAFERRVLLTGPSPEALLAAADTTGFEVVRCPEAASGQSASLRRGIAAVKGSGGVVVLLADQPLIGPRAIEALIAGRDASRLATRATYGGTPGHPTLIEPAAFPSIASLRGDRGARSILASDQGLVDCTALADPLDIDTPADLEAAAVRLSARA